jgi:hypothetical protein
MNIAIEGTENLPAGEYAASLQAVQGGSGLVLRAIPDVPVGTTPYTVSVG